MPEAGSGFAIVCPRADARLSCVHEACPASAPMRTTSICPPRRFTRARTGRPGVQRLTLERSGKLLTQYGQKGAEAATVIFDPRGKLIAQRDLHADAAHRYVGDSVLPVLSREIPIELNPGAVCARDFASNDRIAGDRSATDDPERCAAIVIKPVAQSSNRKIRVHSEEFLLFLRRRGQAIPA